MGANSMPRRLLVGAACLPALTLLTAALAQTPPSSPEPVQASSAQIPANPHLPSVPNSASNQNGVSLAALNTGKTSLPVPANTRPITSEEHADIFLARKDYAAAADYYRRALDERGSRNPAALWNKLGIAYQLNMNYAAARKAYKDATRTDTAFAEPWNNLGTTYFLQNKFGKSTKYYKHAIKLRPDAVSFHMNLSASYSRMKKFDQAVEECREALRLDPNVLIEHSPGATTVQARGADVQFYYYLAKVFASMSRPEDAVRYLRRALEDGFKDMKRLDQDPDFQKISRYPAYVQLRKNPPFAIED
jgi:tetratricopeptide (TPR) repeat protein